MFYFTCKINIIYINDLIESCQQYSDIYVFADDAKFFRHINQSQDSCELQEAINILHKWSSQWLLKLNIKNVTLSHSVKMLT